MAGQTFMTISLIGKPESAVYEPWQDAFSDHRQWEDKKCNKRNPRVSDFIHTTAKKALWINTSFNPPWLHLRLVRCQELGQSSFSTPENSGRVARQNTFERSFRQIDRRGWTIDLSSPKYPDFKHESRREGQIQPNGGLKLCYGGDLSKLCQEGRLKEALHIVELMVRRHTQAPIHAYAALLKECARKKALLEGKRLHSLILQNGLDSNIFLGNTLIDMYAKCGGVLNARRVFNTMPEHNVFTWTAIISAYANQGQCEEAINLFQQMQQTCITPDKVTFVVVLKACARTAALELGKQVHSRIVESGIELDVIVGSALLDMYVKCGCIEQARLMFNKLSEQDVVSWSTMIAGYAQQGLGKEALALYEQMKQAGVQPNKVTYVILLKACASIAALANGKEFHSLIVKNGYESDVIVQNALISMYANCGSIEQARQIFNKMSERDVISWSEMIGGYAQQGLSKEAIALYEQMKQEGIQPNKVTYLFLLKACASVTALEKGKQLHSQIIRSSVELDVVLGSALVDMYMKCGSIEHANQVFNDMHERDIVAWNVMLAGYAQQGLIKEALALYEQMNQGYVQPNNVTYVILLKACASIAALQQGKQIHSHIIKSRLELDVIVNSALVDMYAKCGSIDHACQVFNNIREWDVVVWTAMVAGYAMQGLGKEALTLFKKMRREGMKPNGITYVSVLCACSHSGLVDEARQLFDSMSKEDDITPTMDHYACIVDVLGRAGFLADAEDFINKMPMQPDAVVWRTLLSAARNHGYLETAKRAFDCLIKLEPENDAMYVLLSNIHAAADRMDEGEKRK